MTFADALKRMDDIVMNWQPGEQAETCRVRRQDLRELLHHFRRLDDEARARHHAADPTPKPRTTGWQAMNTAPKDGKHVILAIRTECGCFVYSIQGAFMQGEWMNAANIKTEPLAWMPNVLLPDEFCPWTDEFKDRALAASEGRNDG